MDELDQLLVTLPFLLLGGIILLCGALSVLKLARSLKTAEVRPQRNAIYMMALCFIALSVLYKIWYWLMWQMG